MTWLEKFGLFLSHHLVPLAYVHRVTFSWFVIKD